MRQPTRYDRRFQQILAQLNERQREAVEQTEGPMLVLAGPGTGKTHLLAARIGQILQLPDQHAYNILCLTYTDAGVHAMRQRLLSFIGPEAHRVHINTYHSFCNGVIQENLFQFGKRDLEAISSLEKIELLQDLIDRLPSDHVLRGQSYNPYYYLDHLDHLFHVMKTEFWTTDYVLRQVDAYMESLSERPEFTYRRKYKQYEAGDLKPSAVEKAEEQMAKLRAGAELFGEYKRMMRQRGRYDYDDMLLWVLELFEQSENIRRRYQEQYQYILVDEYQDTNGAQNQLLNLLTEFWTQPNIFIVGDDDQAVYEFQGARVRSMLDFKEQYADELRLIVLDRNYRSSQVLLDSATGLIDRNRIRIVTQDGDLQKQLIAGNDTVATLDQEPELRIFDNRVQEVAYLVQDITKRIAEGTPPQEIAILYNKHKQAEPLIRLLEQQGIAYTTRRRLNILHEPLIRRIRVMMQYFRGEYERPHSREELLFRMLYFDFIGILPADIAALATYLTRRIRDRKSPIPWREAVQSPDILIKAGIPTGRHTPWQHLAAFVDQMLAEYANLSLVRWLERLINKSGMLRRVLRHPDKSAQLQMLTTFFQFVKREADKQPRLQLGDLLDILTNMDANRLPLPLQQVTHAAEGVQLITAHSAKGLEFDVVYLLDCTRVWDGKQRGSRGEFVYPDTLTFSGEEDLEEAQRRLFYVAMTRARHSLYLSYSRTDEQGKPTDPTRYIDELLDADALAVTTPQPDTALLDTAQLLLLTTDDAPEALLPDKDTLDLLLQDFKMSATSLNTYLDCPLSFYFQHVLRVPSTSSEAANYGTAMHEALYDFFSMMLDNPGEIFPAVDYLVGQFEREMRYRQPYFGAREYERRLEKGRRALRALYRERIDSWHQNVDLERNYRNIEVEGVPLTGKVDKVEYLDHALSRIVDYKTGRLKREQTARPGKRQEHGGAYWRQLVFYKLLHDNHRGNVRVARSGRIAYLDPDASGEFPVVDVAFKAGDTQFMTSLITATYERILAHDFATGCGKPKCKWCNFVQHDMLPDSFASAVVEGMDE